MTHPPPIELPSPPLLRPTRLNDGGWAHVAITGTANACVHVASGPYDVQPDAGSTDTTCDGVTIPSSGQGSAVIYGRLYRSGQLRVELAAR